MEEWQRGKEASHNRVASIAEHKDAGEEGNDVAWECCMAAAAWVRE